MSKDLTPSGEPRPPHKPSGETGAVVVVTHGSGPDADTEDAGATSWRDSA